MDELGKETLKPLLEGVITDAAANHVPQHQALTVSHRLGGTRVATTKLSQRKIEALLNIGSELLQHIASVLGPPALTFLHQVIGEIGGESFAPVAARIIDVHRVPPPVVEDLVRIG